MLPTADPTKPTVVYFDINGKAAAIRMLFSYCKQEFIDCRLSKEQFDELVAKDCLPLG
jgi:hypothetical protein